jgi:transposase-like protein
MDTLNVEKALVVVAAEEDGVGIGRIRLRQIVDASAQSLIPFVRESVVAGSTVHTDGWLGYLPLKSSEYKHEVTYLKGNTKTASELLPRVHLVISHLKRWMMGTHQGAISRKHLDYYLHEFTFRFNRRRSKNRGKLFFSARAASRDSRACNAGSNSSSRHERSRETTTCWAYLS